MNKELMGVAEALAALAESLKVLAGVEAKEEVKAEPEAKEEKKAEKKKTITLEEVRKVLSEKSGAGFTAEVKELLSRHGGSKLSAIDPAEYEQILTEAKEIGNECSAQ